MDAILAETYGIMVYQEQVMQIFNQLGGIELSNACKLIKAISEENGPTSSPSSQPRVHQGHDGQEAIEQGQGRGDLRPDPEVRRLRLQQEHITRLRDRRVPDGVHEDVPPRRVHGGVVLERNRALEMASKERSRSSSITSTSAAAWESRCCRRT